jgi:hypothetical protein
MIAMSCCTLSCEIKESCAIFKAEVERRLRPAIMRSRGKPQTAEQKLSHNKQAVGPLHLQGTRLRLLEIHSRGEKCRESKVPTPEND